MRPHIICFTLLTSSILSFSCTQQESESGHNSQTLPSEPTITLDEVAVVESFGDHYFTGLRTPLPTENGDLIVSTFNAQMLFRISADGGLLQTIGREGRGPGEFQMIRGKVMAPGDTVHVFDFNNMRQQLLAYDGEMWSQAREVERIQSSPEDTGLLYFEPTSVFEVDNELMGLFRNRIVQADTATMFHSWLARLDHNLNPSDNDKILLKPSEKPMIINVSGGTHVLSHPYSYRLFREWNPATELLAEVANTDAVLRLYSADGEKIRAIRLPYEKKEPDLSERDRYERQMTRDYSSDAAQEARQMSLPHEPLISSFLIDNEGRYWLQMSRVEEGRPNWIVFSDEGELLGSLHLTEDLDAGTLARPLLVHNNRMYALHYHDFEPSLRIYDVSFNALVSGE